eukprot:scaffold3559_cov284-Chaetoceros_neogracile.AAC.28
MALLAGIFRNLGGQPFLFFKLPPTASCVSAEYRGKCHDSAIKLFCLASLACSLDGKTNGSKKIISRPNPPKQCTQSALNTNAMGVYFGHRFNANKKGRHPDFSLHSLERLHALILPAKKESFLERNS